MGIAFMMFFIEYYRLWYNGVRLGQKHCLMAYEDLERKVRRISIAFIMYFVMSYILLILFTKGFLDCVARGAILSALVFPITNAHFS
jgi:uncharacterized membrane protein (DUF485 family)